MPPGRSQVERCVAVGRRRFHVCGGLHRHLAHVVVSIFSRQVQSSHTFIGNYRHAGPFVEQDL